MGALRSRDGLIFKVLLIIAATLWVYSPAFHGGWLWDDFRYVPENGLRYDPLRLWKSWFEVDRCMEYYPIESTVQLAQWIVWGQDTLGYHLTNIGLHIISSLLIWRLLAKIGVRLAWLGGLIFAIHPMVVESVAWITELKNTLSLPPLLLAMCLYIEYDKNRNGRDYAVIFGLFLAAILCKSTVMMFPPVILLYAWWKRGRIGWDDVKASVPFFAISLIFGLLGLQLMLHFHQDLFPAPPCSRRARLDTIGREMIYYIVRFFVPVNLLPIYPSGLVVPSAIGLLPWLVTAGALYVSWWNRATWGRHVLLGLGFFLLNMVPTLGSIYGSLPKMVWSLDHMFYIPIIGLIGLIVAAAGQVQERLSPSIRPLGVVLMTIVLVLLAVDTHRYVGYYRNEEIFWRYTLQGFPTSAMAHGNLGHYLLRSGRVQEAVDQLGQALQIDETSAVACNNLGNALRREGREKEALEQFERAVKLDPDYHEAHNNLGNMLVQFGQLPEAIKHFNQALTLRPDYPEAHNGLGNALILSGKIVPAIEQYRMALWYESAMPEAHNGLGNALLQVGQLPEARAQCEEALKYKPDYTEAYCTLGLIQVQMGQIPEAIDCFRKAVELEPQNAKIRKGLEWVESLQKDGTIQK
jgi:tetratricopeptide (TPR) repeat protein